MSSDITRQGRDRHPTDPSDREYLWFALLLIFVLLSLADR